ncbi:MAG: Rrf2 family transcriptional regulator [Eubacteriales bacterium]|nr:Rrf2 family transcriptional regulator [Eubacteriales bacterium]
MRITRGADYAIRLAYCLAIHGSMVGTRQLAEETGVTQRFTLKILQSLVQSGIVTSQQGKKGGYRLNRDPHEISVGLLVELIDGPVEINHCLNACFDCTHMGEDKNGCEFHLAFQSVNEAIREQLYALTLDQFLPKKESEETE